MKFLVIGQAPLKADSSPYSGLLHDKLTNEKHSLTFADYAKVCTQTADAEEANALFGKADMVVYHFEASADHSQELTGLLRRHRGIVVFANAQLENSILTQIATQARAVIINDMRIAETVKSYCPGPIAFLDDIYDAETYGTCITKIAAIVVNLKNKTKIVDNIAELITDWSDNLSPSYFKYINNPLNVIFSQQE